MIKKLSLLLLFVCTYMSTFQLNAQDAVPINPQFTGDLLVSALMSDRFVIPNNDNTATGVVGLFVNEKRDEIVVNVYADNTTGNLTEVQIREGNVNQTGDLILDLTEFIDGKKINTVISNVRKQISSELIRGSYYIEIKTEGSEEAAARGNLRLESERSYIGIATSENILDGTSDSEAQGIISTHFTPLINNLEVNFFATDLSSPITNAFLHLGNSQTVEGDTLVDLMEFVTDNRIAADITADSLFRANLALNRIYIQIYTEDFPNGEIRGQFGVTNQLVHDGWISGDQVVNGTQPESGINGFGQFILNTSFNTVEYRIITDNLDEELTSVTINSAALGSEGEELYNLDSSINGKIAFGTLDDGGLTFLSGQLLKGDAYINIATEDFPEGRIRGQLYRVARDGHLFTFCSNQVSSDIVSDADGGGVVAINRKKSFAHTLASIFDLSSPAEAITINSGGFGETGEARFDFITLIVPQTGIINRYWTNSNPLFPAFEIAYADQIKNSEAHFLVTTEDNPDGELRGQFLSKLNCTNNFNESADLDLTLTTSRAHYAQYDTLAFTFTVTNTGFLAADDISVSVPLPDGFVYCYDIAGDGEYNLFYQTWNVGTLAPGESATLTIVNLAMSSGNNINYFAEVENSSAFDHDSTPGNQNFDADEDDEVAMTILAVENGGSGTGDFVIDLEVDMAVDNNQVGQYENANYTITVKNNGSDFANNILMNVKIPPGLAYVSHSASKGDVRLYNGTWFIQTLSAGETATFNIELFTLWPSSTISYFVQVHSADEPDKDSTPGNVYDFIVSEDDEARIDLLTTANMPQNNVSFRVESLNQGIVYPNPSVDQVNMDIQSGIDVEGEILIYNISGQILSRTETNFNQGFNEFNYDVSDFPVGTYFIKIPALDITSKFLKI